MALQYTDQFKDINGSAKSLTFFLLFLPFFLLFLS